MSNHRASLVRRGLWLNYLTIGYNVLEALASLAAGLISGSVALVAFGVDSAIEIGSSIAAQWRLRLDVDEARRTRAEFIATRIVAWLLLCLAVSVAVEAARSLWLREAPSRSAVGVIVLMLSAIVMPVLARAKRRVATELASNALQAEALQTSLCAYLSMIALVGVALNALFGWWWADPITALIMVPIIAKEGIEGLRGRTTGVDCRSDGVLAQQQNLIH